MVRNLEFGTGVGSENEANYLDWLFDNGNLAGKRADVKTENLDIDYEFHKLHYFDIQVELLKYHYSEGDGFHILFGLDFDIAEYHNNFEVRIDVVVCH